MVPAQPFRISNPEWREEHFILVINLYHTSTHCSHLTPLRRRTKHLELRRKEKKEEETNDSRILLKFSQSIERKINSTRRGYIKKKKSNRYFFCRWSIVLLLWIKCADSQSEYERHEEAINCALPF